MRYPFSPILPGLLIIVMSCVLPAWARDAAKLPAVTVNTPREGVLPFEAAASVDRVEGTGIRAGRMQAQLSEGLASVPGLQLQNRHNFAQDLQLSIRGFGARAAFGVRGVRLYVDGIPATMPDGQGQTSNIDIASLDRVEIMRGPFSALHGNSAGGVVQAFTATGEGLPRLSHSAAAGSFGSWRQGVQASGAEGKVDYLFSANRYRTDGWRDHAAARRDLANAKLGVTLANGGRLQWVFNRVRITAQDPLGLTAEQFAGAPRSAALAAQYDTRKTVRQNQAGLLWEHDLDAGQQLRVMLYRGRRETVQYQSIPPSAQTNPRHAGGVIDLQRDYGGLDVRWLGATELVGRPLALVAGLSYDDLEERRKGYENFLGSADVPQLGARGALRRQERNGVTSLDPYLQATWFLTDAWSLEAGVRRSRLRFDSRDQYITAGNGDDSGRVRHARTLPVAALRWQPADDLALYVSAGRGFETPTLNELSYRPDGEGGLNFHLRPAINDNVEFGAKARVAGGLLTAALFETRTRNEIVTASSSGGRTTFQNAGRTRRQGFELGWQHETADHWQTRLALSWLDARYRDSFCSPAPCASAADQVAKGRRIPGVARQALFASVGWQPPQGWRAGVELHALSRIDADDHNTVHAPGHATTALHVGYEKRWQHWELGAFARVDNLFDRRYAGSLIVNERNGRYFEPAPGRNWAVGFDAAYRF